MTKSPTFDRTCEIGQLFHLSWHQIIDHADNASKNVRALYVCSKQYKACNRLSNQVTDFI